MWNGHTAQPAGRKAIKKIYEQNVYNFFVFFFFLRAKWGVTGSRKLRIIREFPTHTSMNTLVVFHFIDISKNFKLNSACRKTDHPCNLLKTKHQ